MKRVLACVMSVVLAVGLMPVAAHADFDMVAISGDPFVALQVGEASEVKAVDVVLSDANLYDAVVEQLTAQKIPFTTEQAAKRVKLTAAGNAALTTLKLNNKSIGSLSGLEAFTGLKWLDLSHNSVASTSEFATMKRLEHLDLYDNMIRDFTGLRGLTSLKELNLGDNNEVSASALSGLEAIDTLTGLTSLDFSRNNEPAIASHVAKLTELTFLNLQQNKIADISGLKDLKKMKTLILCHNNIAGV